MNSYDEKRLFAMFILQRGLGFLSDFDVRDNNPVQITTVILFNKLLNDLDSIIVMVEKGFIDQPFVVTRTMIDKLFVISALTKDESKMEELQKHFEYQQKGKVKKAYNLDLIDEDAKEAKLSDFGGRNITTSEWAEWAGMKDTYDREYTLFSDFIHVSLSSIENCLVRESGKIKAIDMAPDVKRKEELLATASYYALLATERMCEYFKIEMTDQEEVEKTFSKIAAPYFVQDDQNNRG